MHDNTLFTIRYALLVHIYSKIVTIRSTFKTLKPHIRLDKHSQTKQPTHGGNIQNKYRAKVHSLHQQCIVVSEEGDRNSHKPHE